jgi:hypothetical protein
LNQELRLFARIASKALLRVFPGRPEKGLPVVEAGSRERGGVEAYACTPGLMRLEGTRQKALQELSGIRRRL